MYTVCFLLDLAIPYTSKKWEFIESVFYTGLKSPWCEIVLFVCLKIVFYLDIQMIHDCLTFLFNLQPEVLPQTK